MNGVYQQLYDQITNVIYGGQLDAYQELVATLISTGACIFMVALPFIVVYMVIRLVTRW